jgi:hypothetical protein
MAHFLTVPINENGIITDGHIDDEIKYAAVAPFAFTDVFFYSHGWWTTAVASMADYNDFSIGFARTIHNLIKQSPGSVPKINSGFSALSIGLHWPSTLSEDSRLVVSFVEAASFFTMEYRADDVGQTGGYALIRLLLESRKGAAPFRFHLLGHSFGCRVVLSTLQQLTADTDTLALAAHAQFNVVLIQAAADSDSLAPGKLYKDILSSFPNLKVLATTSANDQALNKWYPAAQNLAHLFRGSVPALGATGFVGNPAPGAIHSIAIGPGSVPPPTGQFVVADLTPLHKDRYAKDPAVWNVFSGQHSDIYVDEIAVRDVDYVRVRLEALNDFIDQHEKRGPLDLTLCNMISSGLDRRRNQGGPQSAAVDPGRPGRRNRRAPDNAISLGARRDRGPGAGGEVG